MKTIAEDARKLRHYGVHVSFGPVSSVQLPRVRDVAGADVGREVWHFGLEALLASEGGTPAQGS